MRRAFPHGRLLRRSWRRHVATRRRIGPFVHLQTPSPRRTIVVRAVHDAQRARVSNRENDMATAEEPLQHVLCVEADAGSRALLHDALKDYQLTFAVDGYEAVREINRRPFHAYIFGYWLPGWSSVAACREIRRADPAVPVVFCDRNIERYSARALRAGASHCCEKPINPATFRRRLRILLERAENCSTRAQLDERRAI